VPRPKEGLFDLLVTVPWWVSVLVAGGGVDMILHEGGKYLVQCKHWKAYRVGVKEVRELLGLVTAELAEGGILITSGPFTAEARSFSRGNPLTLVDGGELVRLTREVQVAGSAAEKSGAGAAPAARVAGTTPSCPRCKRPMVLRTAKSGANAGGQSWGCSGFPDCRATLSLT